MTETTASDTPTAPKKKTAKKTTTKKAIDTIKEKAPHLTMKLLKTMIDDLREELQQKDATLHHLQQTISIMHPLVIDDEEEHVIGTYCGKPLYCKQFVGSNDVVDKDSIHGHIKFIGKLDIETIVNICGCSQRVGYSRESSPIASLCDEVKIFFKSTWHSTWIHELRIDKENYKTGGDDRNYYITLWYTKTSDKRRIPCQK